MSKIRFMSMLTALLSSGMGKDQAYREASIMIDNMNKGVIFIPKKHTKMSYAKQNRLAKKRRNRSMYAGK